MARKKSINKQESVTTSIPLPFTILIDKQEKLPYSFRDIASNADTNYLPFEPKIEKAHLDYLGDYSLRAEDLGPFDHPKIMIERKSPEDLFGSVAKRENFEHRLSRLDEECEFAAVVVESELMAMRANPPAFSSLSFKVVHNTIQSWQQRYRRVHWTFYPDRDWAEVGTFWYLYRFYENIKYHKLDQDRKRTRWATLWAGAEAFARKMPITSCPHKREHASGCLHDIWVMGWLEAERIKQGRPFNSSEAITIYQGPREGRISDGTRKQAEA